jgi:hypothetical protein
MKIENILLTIIVLLLAGLLYRSSSAPTTKFELHEVETDENRHLYVGFETTTGKVCSPFDADPKWVDNDGRTLAVDRCRDLK